MMEMLRNGEKINTLEVQFTKFRLVELEKSEVWEENMSTYVLTSMFPDGIHGKNRELFQTLVTQRKSFALSHPNLKRIMVRQIAIFIFF